MPSHRSTLIDSRRIGIQPSHFARSHRQIAPPRHSAKPVRQLTPPTDTAKRGAGQRAPTTACDHSPLGGSVLSHRRTLLDSGRIGIQPSHSAKSHRQVAPPSRSANRLPCFPEAADLVACVVVLGGKVLPSVSADSLETHWAVVVCGLFPHFFRFPSHLKRLSLWQLDAAPRLDTPPREKSLAEISSCGRITPPWGRAAEASPRISLGLPLGFSRVKQLETGPTSPPEEGSRFSPARDRPARMPPFNIHGLLAVQAQFRGHPGIF